MSGSCADSICPSCGSPGMTVYTDWKPHEVVDARCLNCGLYVTTIEGKMPLKEVNFLRRDGGLKPLKKLPKTKLCCG